MADPTMADPIDRADGGELAAQSWEIQATFGWIDEMLEALDRDLARLSPLATLRDILRARGGG